MNNCNDAYGNLLSSLNEEEKMQLFISYIESFDENNLISHDQVKLQHDKWLKPLPPNECSASN